MKKICAHCSKPFDADTKKSRRWKCCSAECGAARRIEGTQARWARQSPWDRFMSHIIPVTESGCWLWETDSDVDGMRYGQFDDKGRSFCAHRWAYEYKNGPVSKDLELDHLCRVRCCANPDHVEPVTPRINKLRGISPVAVNAKKTHCVHGHSFDDRNTGVDKSGNRYCRKCQFNNVRSSRNVKRKLAIRNLARVVRSLEGSASFKEFMGQVVMDYEEVGR